MTVTVVAQRGQLDVYQLDPTTFQISTKADKYADDWAPLLAARLRGLAVEEALVELHKLPGRALPQNDFTLWEQTIEVPRPSRPTSEPRVRAQAPKKAREHGEILQEKRREKIESVFDSSHQIWTTLAAIDLEPTGEFRRLVEVAQLDPKSSSGMLA